MDALGRARALLLRLHNHLRVQPIRSRLRSGGFRNGEQGRRGVREHRRINVLDGHEQGVLAHRAHTCVQIDDECERLVEPTVPRQVRGPDIVQVRVAFGDAYGRCRAV